MKIKPIPYRQAADYINKNHRHHNAPQGMKWAIGVFNGNDICGVATAGRPVSRKLDDGMTCEITRVCTDGTRNACSFLYGACCRVAKAMGYKRVITYTLESENGASVKAANFKYDGEAGGTHWTGVRDRGQYIPNEMKKRWVRDL